VLPSVYATFTGDLAERQRHIAAQLYAGTRAHLAGTTALTIYGFRYAPADGHVHVLVPHGCHLTSREFVRIHRTRRPDPHARPMPPLLVSGPARAVADAARWSDSERAVRAMVAEAVQRGLVTVPALEAQLRNGKINGSRLLRLALRDVGAGVRSAPEGDLRSALRSSKVLPEIRWNPTLVGTDGTRLPTPDGWLADGGIALEMDSREYHLSPEDWQRTLERGNRLAGEGALVLHFTPERVRRDPVGVRREVERAYLARQATTVGISLPHQGVPDEGEHRQGVPEGVIAPSGTP
jgi:hypothetical protein